MVLITLVILIGATLVWAERSPASSGRIEAEALLGWAEATEGELSIEDLGNYGERFRGEGQLLWSPKHEGARLRLDAVVDRGGRREIVVVLTVAPSYGVVEIHLDGSLRATLNGYDASRGWTEVSLGIEELEAGPHELLFQVVGKDPSSSGHEVGIDRIDFLHLNPPVTRP
jgi:hypothetical protein